MRYALALKPGSEEAKKNGCICDGKEGMFDGNCPVHFPMRYIGKINNIENYLEETVSHLKTLFIITIILLISMIASVVATTV